MKQQVSTPIVIAIVVIVVAIAVYFGFKVMGPDSSKTYHSNMAEQMKDQMTKMHGGGAGSANGGAPAIPPAAH